MKKSFLVLELFLVLEPTGIGDGIVFRITNSPTRTVCRIYFVDCDIYVALCSNCLHSSQFSSLSITCEDI
jgi:hypothetical protein